MLRLIWLKGLFVLLILVPAFAADENFPNDPAVQQNSEATSGTVATLHGPTPDKVEPTERTEGLRTITPEELIQVLTAHRDYFETNGRRGKQADFSGMDLRGRDFEGAFLSCAILTGADLSGATLINAQMKNVYLTGGNLTNAKLRRANISNIADHNSTLNNAVFINADLSEADLTGADLSGAVLDGAILSGTTLVQVTGSLSQLLRSATDIRSIRIKSSKCYVGDISGGDLSGWDLTGINMKGGNLSGATLIGVDLAGQDLRSATLSETNLSGATLYRANLAGLDLRRTVLRKAFLSDANLENANLSGVDLQEANLHGAVVSRARLENTQLAGATLYQADLTGCDLRKTPLKHAHLAGVTLVETNLDGVDLAGIDLTGANLTGASLKGTQLGGAILRHIDFSGKDLKGTILNRSILSGATLVGVDLSGVDLSRVDFSAASLDNAKLCDCKLSEADLTDSSVRGTDFSGSDLSNVIFEPRDPPESGHIWRAKNLSSLRFKISPKALFDLKKDLELKGFPDESRQVLYAMKHTQTMIRLNEGGLIDRLQSFFPWVLLDLTCEYGNAPFLALKWLGCIIVAFSFVYFGFLKKQSSETFRTGKRSQDDGIWIHWPNERMRLDKGSMERELIYLSGFPAYRKAFKFSVFCAFSIGWRDINVGTLITRLQRDEYVLRATGWARTISTLQSVICLYLFALFILGYFGKLFREF